MQTRRRLGGEAHRRTSSDERRHVRPESGSDVIGGQCCGACAQQLIIGRSVPSFMDIYALGCTDLWTSLQIAMIGTWH